MDGFFALTLEYELVQVDGFDHSERVVICLLEYIFNAPKCFRLAEACMLHVNILFYRKVQSVSRLGLCGRRT